MPIIIRELHMSAEVMEEHPTPTREVQPATGSGTDMQALIAAAVEQTIKRLKIKEER